MASRFFSRRSLLTFGARVAGVVTAFAASRSFAADAGTICVDMNQTSSNKSLRDSLHFTEKFSDPKMACGMCAFFTGAAGAACGECKIFTGPTNPAGHCDSWSPREG